MSIVISIFLHLAFHEIPCQSIKTAELKSFWVLFLLVAMAFMVVEFRVELVSLLWILGHIKTETSSVLPVTEQIVHGDYLVRMNI